MRRTFSNRRVRLVGFLVVVASAGLGTLPASSHSNNDGPRASLVTFNTMPGGWPSSTQVMGTRSMPSMSGFKCVWGSSTAVTLQWNALASNDQWVDGFQVLSRTNGTGAYSTLGSQVTPGSATSTSITPSSPTSNFYDYKMYAQAGTNWNGSTTSSVRSSTCDKAIGTLAKTATGAQNKTINGVYVDTTGNVYFADTGGNRIKFVPKYAGTYFGTSMVAGYQYTIAGTGTAGAIGTGGAGTSNKVSSPEGIWADSSGNVYFANTGAHEVGAIAMSASSTLFGVSFTSAGEMHRVGGSGSSASAVNAATVANSRFNGPKGVAMDTFGDLLVSDTNNNAIQILLASGGTTRYGSSGSTANTWYTILNTTISSPTQITTDSSTNNLYISDTGNNVVRKYTYSSPTLSTVAGNGLTGALGDGGTATNARLSSTVDGLAFDANNKVLYITDTGNNQIRAVCLLGSTCHAVFGAASSGTTGDIANGNIDRIAGVSGGGSGYTGEGYSGLSSKLSAPRGASFGSDGYLYIADGTNSMVRRLSPYSVDQYAILAVAGNGTNSEADGVIAASAALGQVDGMAVDSSNNIYMADQGDNRIREYVALTGNVITLAGTGASASQGNGASALAASVNAPTGVAVDGNGVVYLSDTAANKVRAICPPTSGSSCSVFGVTIAAGNIDVIAGTGTASTTGDAGTATSATINGPRGLDVDASGDLLIADYGGAEIRYMPNGAYTSNTFGNGTVAVGKIYKAANSFSGPNAARWESDKGKVLVADANANKIIEISNSNGAKTVLAGSGVSGATDANPATSATFNSPQGVWLSGTTVYVADTGSNKIRTFPLAGGQTASIIGTGTAGLSNDGARGLDAQIAPYDVVRASNGNLWVTQNASGANAGLRILWNQYGGGY